MARNIVLWVIIALVMMIIFQSFSPQRTSNSSISYSDFVSAVKSGRVSTVKIDGTQIEVQMHDGSRMFTFSPETDNGPLIGSLLDNQVRIEAIPPERQSLLTQIFISWFPFLLLIGVWIYVMRQMQGGGGGRGALSFGKSVFPRTKIFRFGKHVFSHKQREVGEGHMRRANKRTENASLASPQPRMQSPGAPVHEQDLGGPSTAL